MTDHTQTPVVDVFAGPGGLGEGFSAYARDGACPFRIALSVEKDPYAWLTLSLRCFFRQFGYEGKPVPNEYYRHVADPESLTRNQLFDQFPAEAKAAYAEAWHAELGDTSIEQELERRIGDAVANADHWVLIGGPPCQAYSVAGRSRNCRNKTFDQDPRHFLYEEYLHIIARHWPSVFVMENVTGILTSRPGGEKIFPEIQRDLTDPGWATGSPSRRRYRLYSFVTAKPQDALSPGDFVIRSEEYGIPQARHRVIILGIRDDLAGSDYVPPVLRGQGNPVNVEQVLTLPRLRSGLSRNARLPDSWENWCEALLRARVAPWLFSINDRVRESIEKTLARLEDRMYRLSRSPSGTGSAPAFEPDWYLDDRVTVALNHEARGHRDDDLHRYLFAACSDGTIFSRPGRRLAPKPGGRPGTLNWGRSIQSRDNNLREVRHAKANHLVAR